MTDDRESPQEPKSGGKSSRRRSSRRRRERKAAPEAHAPREKPNAKAKQEKALDKAQRERRERRRRRRQQAKQPDAPEMQFLGGTLAQDEELNRPSPPVVVYTHVIRPDVRDNYEFRSEHFSKVTRRLEDFHIDLTPFLRSVEEEEERSRNVREYSDEDWDLDDDWGDEDVDEGMDEDMASTPTLAESPTVEELEDFDDTDPDAGDERAGADAGR